MNHLPLLSSWLLDCRSHVHVLHLLYYYLDIVRYTYLLCRDNTVCKVSARSIIMMIVNK